MLKFMFLAAGMAALLLIGAAAFAAGCPAGSKRHCVQTKSGIQCYCR
ncbi:MAG TPA: hypothetical protein VKY24_02490 [Reyranella sp.]|nr:hypothetical protein [Reyranella sp.]